MDLCLQVTLVYGSAVGTARLGHAAAPQNQIFAKLDKKISNQGSGQNSSQLKLLLPSAVHLKERLTVSQSVL